MKNGLYQVTEQMVSIRQKKHEIQVDLPSQRLNRFVNGFVERLHGV